MADRNPCKVCSTQHTVVFVRHGESEWNRRNIFCGWYDADLSEEGIQQAVKIGEQLKDFDFDIIYTSLLRRAYDSVEMVLKTMGKTITVIKAWQLNERHYGALTGLNKAETAEKYGLEKVQIWRRSYDVLPPPMEKDHHLYNAIVNNPVFLQHGIEEKDIPKTESLKTTLSRVLPYWENVIGPVIKEGKRVLIIAHGTSLRGLVKHIDSLSEEEIMKLNLPTGIPFSYTLDKNLKPVTSRKFFCDDETLKREVEKVAGIGTKEQ
ncbi:Phosphoglycerate mutase [Gryllus bimaculatus]|nr:Phosphoglycerate mutase [Gryllus bimaculatus]